MKKILLIVFLSVLLLLVGCKKEMRLKSDYGLYSIRDKAQLRSFLTPRKGLFGGYAKSDVDLPAVEDASAGTDDNYTKTNVQVEGVDEGDVVKTDGKRIYAINENHLRVIEILDNGKINLALNETFYNARLNDLYLSDKYLVVIGQQYSYRQYEYTDALQYNYASVIYIYSLNDLKMVKHYEISGHLITSRLIDNNLYLISLYSPGYEQEELRPWIIEDDTGVFVDYNDIKYLNTSSYQSYSIITSVILDDEIKYDKDVFLGSGYWGNIYVNKSGIYFATTLYSYSLFGTSSSKGIVISYLFDDEKHVVYGGMAEFAGHVINQFAMDEYNGYLRLASTEGWGNGVQNRLYIFKRELKDNKYSLTKVGLLDKGLGKPGEQIKSVRFNQDMATVVTYLNTDPLYTIDLSDPTNPVILGELIVSGYSTYQQPWGDGLILGIGYEAEGTQITGLKLALYDVSDSNKPVEINKPLVLDNGDGWQYSEAMFNHKAIMIDISNQQFGFATHKYNRSSQIESQFILFAVDKTKEEPVSIKNTISHLEYRSQISPIKSSGYSLFIERGLRINNYLYVISGEVITAHKLDTGDKVSEIIFSKLVK